MVREHPRRGGARLGRQRQVLLDDLGERRRVPRGEEQVEVEGLAQTLRPGERHPTVRGHPRLGDRHPRRVVLVEQRAPGAVDLVHLVASLERVLPVGEARLDPLLGRQVGGHPGDHRGVLHQQVGHVDPEPVHAPVGPEPQRGEEVLPDLVQRPVEVRLLGGEQVEVPVAVADRLPGGAAEERAPVGRRLGAVGPVAAPDHVAGPRRRPWRRRQRLAEPGVPVRRVVRDDVDDELDPGPVEHRHQLVEVVQRPELGRDRPVVVDVIAAVGEGRRVERAEPDGVHAEPDQMARAVDDPAKVADPVTVGIGEAARVDLVDDRLPPPVAVVGRGRRRGGAERGGHRPTLSTPRGGLAPTSDRRLRAWRQAYSTVVRSPERAQRLLAALVSGGVREVVLCPGSRSAGLAVALYAADAAGDVRLHVRVDERSAGFLALGLAAGSRTPVAVVTTSGTAVGNLLPAVMEAAHSGRRLVLLTADRPAPMRGTGANQTTHQDGIFGVFAPCFDLGVDATAADLEAAAEVATRRRGPTQLNLQLEEPLLPDSEPWWTPQPPRPALDSAAVTRGAEAVGADRRPPGGRRAAPPRPAHRGGRRRRQRVRRADPRRTGRLAAPGRAHVRRAGRRQRRPHLPAAPRPARPRRRHRTRRRARPPDAVATGDAADLARRPRGARRARTRRRRHRPRPGRPAPRRRPHGGRRAADGRGPELARVLARRGPRPLGPARRARRRPPRAGRPPRRARGRGGRRPLRDPGRRLVEPGPGPRPDDHAVHPAPAPVRRGEPRPGRHRRNRLHGGRHRPRSPGRVPDPRAARGRDVPPRRQRAGPRPGRAATRPHPGRRQRRRRVDLRHPGTGRRAVCAGVRARLRDPPRGRPRGPLRSERNGVHESRHAWPACAPRWPTTARVCGWSRPGSTGPGGAPRRRRSPPWPPRRDNRTDEHLHAEPHPVEPDPGRRHDGLAPPRRGAAVAHRPRHRPGPGRERLPDGQQPAERHLHAHRRRGPQLRPRAADRQGHAAAGRRPRVHRPDHHALHGGHARRDGRSAPPRRAGSCSSTPGASPPTTGRWPPSSPS